jgi:predicted  nucleic acid-binding Zn-ribbon protein
MRQYIIDIETMSRRIGDYEHEVKVSVSGYEQEVTLLKRENDELQRRKSENEGKIALLSQELERVSQLLRTKSEEVIRVTQEFEHYRRNREAEFETGYKTLQQNYTVVTSDYENAKRHLIEN